jgi:hypothetical protein
VFGAITKKDISTRKDRVLESNQQQERLMDIAREGVNSIRSSLWLFPAEEGTLQAQITRHSQRLSRLMEMEQQRMSQRMSQLRNSDVDDIASSGPLKDISHPELPRDTFEGLQEAHCSSIDYLQFRTWLLARPWRVQDEIMTTLKADVFSNRLPENLQKISKFHSTAHVNDWLRRADSSSIARGWLQPDTDVVQPLVVQNALPRAVIVPPRPAGPRQHRPFDHGFKNTVRPYMAVREAEDLLAPPSSVKHGALDHRRSRSHDVSGHRDVGLHTYLTSTSRGRDQLQYSFDGKDRYVPPNGLASVSRSHADTANTLQSPSAKTSLKEKRYSMLIAKDTSNLRAPPAFPVQASLKEYMESMGASFPAPTLTAAELHELHYR